jgi:7,8-dihydroneopterin aldolase/epimerase/oxygenase
MWIILMDIIYIRGLRIPAKIGIFEWEQAIRQNLILDIEMSADAKSDEMMVDYAAVSQRLIDYVGNNAFGLIETVAEKISEILLTEFQVKWLRLSVAKPGAVPTAKEVGICIERGIR